MKTKLLITGLLCIGILLSTTNAGAQTRITDSIRHIIHTTTEKNLKLSAILDYCEQYQSLNRDTAYDYAVLALGMAIQTKQRNQVARAELALANSYFLWGWVDSAGAVCDTALQKYKPDDASVRDTYFKLMRQKAMCFGGVGKSPEALAILYQLLRQSETYNDSVTVASTCNTIGSVNIQMEKPDEALRWINKALQYESSDIKFLPVKAAILTNRANAYMSKNAYDSAMPAINKAVPLCREVQNLNTLATALRIRSRLYENVHKNDAAEKDIREMISIRRMLNGGSNSAIVEDNIQLADFYAGSGQLQKAIALCKDNIKVGDIYHQSNPGSFNNHMVNRLDYYKALAKYYKQGSFTKEYTDMLEQIVDAKDSLYAANSAQAIADVQAKYETEQKEKTILQQKYDLTKKNFFIFGSLLLLLLAGIIFYLLFRSYRRRQNIRMELAMQKEQSAKQAAVKEAEEKERRRIAADLHDNLGVQANAILYNAELLKNEPQGSDALVDDLHDTARQMLLNLRETLWAMKTNDIAAGELWVRIISFSKQMGRHYSHIRFSTQGTAPTEMHIPSAKALNIVMIIQEAVQNAVKHSDANDIRISSVTQNGSWHITVHDNGTGFVMEDAYQKRDSYGLKNMQERAALSALEITISSTANKGTGVQISVADS